MPMVSAAVQAGLKSRDIALKDVVMTDVSPYTLGVATLDTTIPGANTMYVTPIIQRNAIVPISRTLSLTTVKDNQKVVDVAIYQGENLRPESNVHLGSLAVPVPPKPEGEAMERQITCRVRPNEEAALKAAAKASGLTLAHWMRPPSTCRACTRRWPRPARKCRACWRK